MNLRKRIAGRLLALCRKAVAAFDRLCARHSKVGDRAIFDERDFPWLPAIEADWRKVRAELDAVMPYMAHMQNFNDIRPNYLTRDGGWKTYFFYGFGLKAPANCRRCPETVKLLKRIPGMKTAFFSILGPHKHLPAHRGPYKGVLRLLLALRIPEPAGRCGMRIGRQGWTWQEGKALLFDDTVQHEAWNNTDDARVLLFVDILRPMRFPANLINAAVTWIIALSPFMLGSAEAYLRWERRFEAIVNADGPARAHTAPET